MSYFTVNGEREVSYEILRSLFICNLKGIDSFEEGLAYVNSVAKKYSDATHNCYAILMDDGEQKCSDDGEPQGTAGQPILQALKKNNLTNVVAVVTRYFGGIKLGAGGLISAYTRCTVDAINASNVVTMEESYNCRLTLNYADYTTFTNYLKNITSKITDIEFGDAVTINVSIRKDLREPFSQTVANITSGEVIVKFVDYGYQYYD